MLSDERDSEEADPTPLVNEALRLLRRDPRGKGRGEEPGFTPFIVLNHDNPATPTGVFYLSPDVWVVSSQGMNLPVQGEENQIFARVHNLGRMDAVNVNVRFYWADPSAAITDQSAHPIGGSDAAATQGGVFIPAAAGAGGDSSVVVPCPSPWVPTQATHECLLVKAWCPGFDPNVAPFEPVLDPVNDRHSAQHNVTVRFVPPGKSFQLSVEVANISGFAQPVRVLVQALDFRQSVERLKSLRVPLRDDLLETERFFPLKVSLSDERSFQHRDNAAFARMLLAADERPTSRATRLEADGRTTLVDLVTDRFAPWERRQLDLSGEVPTWAKPGEVFGFEVTQQLGEFPTGGYVALIVVGKG